MSSVLVKVLQRNRSNIWRDLLLGIGLHDYEPEKSHHLLFASWRPRKASHVMLVYILRPRSQENSWCKSQSKGRRRLLSQLKQVVRKQNSQIFLLSPFCFVWALMGWGDAHPHWGGQATESPVPDANLIWKHCHRHAQESRLIFVWSGRSIKLTITPSFPQSIILLL